MLPAVPEQYWRDASGVSAFGTVTECVFDADEYQKNGAGYCIRDGVREQQLFWEGVLQELSFDAGAVQETEQKQGPSEQNIKVLLKLFQKLATGCGGEEPPQANGTRSVPEKGEQTVETNHPVDGLPERICGPPGGTRGLRPGCSLCNAGPGTFSAFFHAGSNRLQSCEIKITEK